ncbi:MAG: hypothetical protein DHS80DRAFT_22170 [Piptocephalis tieghemiana]|nr:MAG: hypothetical protein DHS80DRAFT_22170 [Piptocephalis tieghemiana]
MSTFGQLFRRSKLARFDPTIPQLYTRRPGTSWGMKRELPPSLRANTVVRITSLDTPQGHASFEFSGYKVRELRMWKEAFPISRLPEPPKATKTTVIDTLSPNAFKNFLARVERWRLEQMEKGVDLSESSVSSAKLLELVGAQVAGDTSLSNTKGPLSLRLNSKFPGTIISSPKDSGIPSGFSYETFTPIRVDSATPLVLSVPGRILSRSADGYNIGIAGVVGRMPIDEAPLSSDFIPIPAYVYRFRVISIEFGRNGKFTPILSGKHWRSRSSTRDSFSQPLKASQ